MEVQKHIKLTLVLAQSLGPPLGSPVQDFLPVLVHLQLHDGDLKYIQGTGIFHVTILNMKRDLTVLINQKHQFAYS
jgi:hypothetical protein